MIEISKVRHIELLDAEEFLNCLKECGVYQWEGYDEAKELLENIREQSEYMSWERLD